MVRECRWGSSFDYLYGFWDSMPLVRVGVVRYDNACRRDS
jgi:hypothetical protein